MRVLWNESPRAEHDPPAALPERTGVAVVGAGIVGSSIALALAGRGVDVTLVERDRVASGASGRNDGQLLLEAAEFYSRMVESRGRQAAGNRVTANHRRLLSQ